MTIGVQSHLDMPCHTLSGLFSVRRRKICRPLPFFIALDSPYKWQRQMTPCEFHYGPCFIGLSFLLYHWLACVRVWSDIGLNAQYIGQLCFYLACRNSDQAASRQLYCSNIARISWRQRISHNNWGIIHLSVRFTHDLSVWLCLAFCLSLYRFVWLTGC